jgi:anti-sigma B factor antagonist
MALSITTSNIDEVIVVHLSGAICFSEESASLRIRVKALLEKSRQIVLDLTSVTRIDSGGLGTLVALYASARKVGGDIKLANPGNHAKEALQITRLVTVFEIFGRQTTRLHLSTEPQQERNRRERETASFSIVGIIYDGQVGGG